MTRSEGARERETHRYYQTWLESSRGYLSPKNITRDDPLLHDATTARHEATQKISRDKALVALAQLGCLRLNVRRGIVTLISSSTSYILAEATRTISLLSGGQHGPGDELWFGTASIPRGQGISEQALDPPVYTAKSADGTSYSAPALVIEDMTVDTRSSGRGYVGNGMMFYAGVPIISKNGFTIGVFSVTDDQPRPASLTIEELQFMQDIASTVMDHLENIRNDTARHRGERMVLGLGAFTEGQASMDGVDGESSTSAPETSSQVSRTSFHLPSFKGITITEIDPNALRSTLRREESSSPEEDASKAILGTESGPNQAVEAFINPSNGHQETHGSIPTSSDSPVTVPEGQRSKVINTDAELGGAAAEVLQENQSPLRVELRQTFARAANILRQCTGSDGVMFFDAQSANVGHGYTPTTATSQGDGNDMSASTDETMSSSGDSGDDFGGGEHEHGYFGRPSPDRETVQSRTSRTRSNAKKCDMLGYSFRLSSVAKMKDEALGLTLREGEMRRFIRRYPKGMVVHFTRDGEVSSSDETNARDRMPDQRARRASTTTNQKEKKRVIAKELIKVVPGARNVIWLPIWDFGKDRWSAGCFVWSSRPERLLNAQDDLIFMKAFANTVMFEVNRLEAIASDQAKTSFVANISHELRSPLHGILGSIEFLQETAVDPFQASMITTVETCGKTLLDTVNHVLDFAKLSKHSTKKDSSQLIGTNAAPASRPEMDADVDLSVLIEEVVEAIYAGQTFRSTGAFHGNEDDSVMSPSVEEVPPKRMTSKRTQSKFSGAVRLLLDIERLDNWCVRTQPGAVRRIVMNLLGNALKYTERGVVSVKLQSTKGKSRNKSSLGFCITVSDTGIGMSVDFARNHAWVAFSQEDSFANGVGLGLSIVRHITSSLGGKIDLQSSKGHGTEIKVLLSAPVVSSPMDASQTVVKAIAKRVKTLKLCILGPGHVKTYGDDAELNNHAEDTLRRMVSSWFGMEVIESPTTENVQADFFIYVEPPSVENLLQHHGLDSANTHVPLIVIAPNAFESASLRKKTQQLKDFGRTIDIISQPCGPQKLARSFERCLYRDPFAAPPDIPNSVPNTAEDKSGVMMGQNSKEQQQSRSHGVDIPNGHHGHQPSSNLGLDDSHSSSDTPTEALSRSQGGSVVSRMSTNPRSPSTFSDDKVSSSVEMADKAPVLLVDDNEVNLKILCAFVRKAGLIYETAQDGLQALELYKEASKDPSRAFRAVVIDVQMPIMDGITATRGIRAFESKTRIHPPATVVALTGFANDATQRDCIGAGVSHFLSKPVKFKEFLKLLER